MSIIISMISKMLSTSKVRPLVFMYSFIITWWLLIQYFDLEAAYLFNWSYGFIALYSGIIGIYIAKKKWGGAKSVVGKMLIFVSLGLFSQLIGLQIWTYYNVIRGVEAPYPSFADIGYFGLVPFYILAAISLSKLGGTKFGLKKKSAKALLVLLPTISIAVCYFTLLKGVELSTASLIKLFFDLAYPLGEIIPFTIVVLTLIVSNKLIGGVFRSRMLLLCLALAVQFMAEYLFLYTTSIGTYINGNFVDMLYASSYFVMGLAIISFGETE
jgi:hypothetical protein